MTNIDFVARLAPTTFKAPIDSALTRIAARAGIGDIVADRLKDLQASEGGSWAYLMLAMDTVRADLKDGVPKLKWASHFLKGEHLQSPPRPPKKKNYPYEAGPALEQGHLVGGYDADLVLLWQRKDGRSSVCHAHPEGFWVLGQDPIDFIERAALEAEGQKQKSIMDAEVDALMDEGDDLAAGGDGDEEPAAEDAD